MRARHTTPRPASVTERPVHPLHQLLILLPPEDAVALVQNVQALTVCHQLTDLLSHLGSDRKCMRSWLTRLSRAMAALSGGAGRRNASWGGEGMAASALRRHGGDRSNDCLTPEPCVRHAGRGPSPLEPPLHWNRRRLKHFHLCALFSVVIPGQRAVAVSQPERWLARPLHGRVSAAPQRPVAVRSTSSRNARGSGALLSRATATREAMQYLRNQAHLCVSAQQGKVSSSRSQARATRTCSHQKLTPQGRSARQPTLPFPNPECRRPPLQAFLSAGPRPGGPYPRPSTLRPARALPWPAAWLVPAQPQRCAWPTPACPRAGQSSGGGRVP